ncbi:hypothetical protein BDQ12DRAFT_413797 [Crucibulum laeve]|uniref:Uncharacterized protein n=1 Tax=Crucibulum laeve TaxID=68775 RepID=A0A5C3M663_9AGAR|nr:hypothetical protein BDQ12DRAFT_413797 [Crucibulum laeve]
MWCTRWFLPLLLLPLPTAPPYFLLLFLFSLTVQAKPCFYCIVLLTTLFVSSCYWQPFPLDSPLSAPWSENITTFAEALNASLPANYSKPLPTVMRTVDRCWCDFAGGFFEPFNVSHWERDSIQRMKEELENERNADVSRSSGESTPGAEGHNASTAMPQTMTLASKPTSIPSTNFWSFIGAKSFGRSKDVISKPSPSHAASSDTASPPLPSSDKALATLPIMRKEYDLRPYGLGLIIDFGWTR